MARSDLSKGTRNQDLFVILMTTNSVYFKNKTMYRPILYRLRQLHLKARWDLKPTVCNLRVRSLSNIKFSGFLFYKLIRLYFVFNKLVWEGTKWYAEKKTKSGYEVRKQIQGPPSPFRTVWLNFLKTEVFIICKRGRITILLTCRMMIICEWNCVNGSTL